jgi:hypothetical protein
MPTDLTPFPKPGMRLGPDRITEHAEPVHRTRPSRNWRLIGRRVAWLVPLWLLGAYASRTIRGYYGGSAVPNATHWMVITGLATAAGVVGAFMFVVTRWRNVFFMASLGAAIWALVFVGAIPATRAVCGGDVVAGCEHVQAIAWPVGTLASYLPILVGLVIPTSLWWRWVRQRSKAHA